MQRPNKMVSCDSLLYLRGRHRNHPITQQTPTQKDNIALMHTCIALVQLTTNCVRKRSRELAASYHYIIKANTNESMHGRQSDTVMLRLRMCFL